jgi:hypothetical protein
VHVLLEGGGEVTTVGTTKERVVRTHIAHCCARHGCKYGSDWCPVVAGEYVQAFPCEQCRVEEDTAKIWAVPSGYASSLPVEQRPSVTVQMVTAEDHKRIVKALMAKLEDESNYQYWEGRKAFKRDVRKALRSGGLIPATVGAFVELVDAIPVDPKPKYTITTKDVLFDKAPGFLIECSECGLVGQTQLNEKIQQQVDAHIAKRHSDG